MFAWYEESTTTPFVKQLLRDLRDMVWHLKRENAKLSMAVDEARLELGQVGNVGDAELIAVKEERKLKEQEAAALGDRVRKLENERLALLYAFGLLFVAFVMFRVM